MRKIWISLIIPAMLLIAAACVSNEKPPAAKPPETNPPATVPPVTEPFSEGLELALSDDEAFYIITGIGTCTDSCVVIPAVYSGKAVTGIGSYAFRNCAGLTEITIPDSVCFIGSLSFVGCSDLTRIRFAGTMAQWNAIGKGAAWIINAGSYTISCTDGNISKADS